MCRLAALGVSGHEPLGPTAVLIGLQVALASIFVSEVYSQLVHLGQRYLAKGLEALHILLETGFLGTSFHSLG